MPRKIILDCDPGHDDAVAMLLAHGSPDIDLLAVTTVAGNHGLEQVTANARSVATVMGLRDTPIAAGCARPLVADQIIAEDIHGVSGLDGPERRPATTSLDARHAVDVIVDLVMAHEPGEITLVPTGPLTNIALAARKEPRLVERVREVVLMGGGYHIGNRTPVAEFNVLADPEAAHVVFSEPWPVTMVGLDLTHQALATSDVVAGIAAVGTTPARFVGELFEFYGSAYRARQAFGAPPVHDPCAVAYVIDPTVMSVRRAPVAVELTGTHTRGMTVTDLRPSAASDCHTQVAVDLVPDRFWSLVVDALERIGEVPS